MSWEADSEREARQAATPQPGDWVRFYLGGRLVIGTVEYMHESKTWPHRWDVQTDQGRIHAGDILEIRKAPSK